jgi:hypothetical protein
LHISDWQISETNQGVMNRQRELTDVRPNPGSHAGALVPAKMKSLVRSDIPYRTNHAAALAATLAVHTQALFGDPPEQRRTRIMVTMPTEAARNYKFVRETRARRNGLHAY